MGSTLAEALQTALDAAVADQLLNYIATYGLNDNLLTIKLIDLEADASVSFVSNYDLVAGVK